MSSKTCRWGILGSAFIAQKNWASIRHSGNGVVAAVASREKSRAEQFIAERQKEVPFESVPEAVGGYQELIDRDDIDAIYLPLPTGLRQEWAIKAAEAGKHLLIEKPCAQDAGHLEELLAVCREKNVQFMDGVMFMHSKRLPALREVLDDSQSIGPVQRIQSHFCFLGDDDFLGTNIRANPQVEPFGCLGDLGWYCLRLSLWVMDWKLPKQVIGRCLQETGEETGKGGPTEFSGEMLFSNGTSAGFYCSFTSAFQQWAWISGERGNIAIPDFVLPHYGKEVAFEVVQDVYRTVGCQFDMEPHRRRVAVLESANNAADSQETNMFRTFADHVLAGKPDRSWDEFSLKTQQVLDACLLSARSGSQPVELAE